MGKTTEKRIFLFDNVKFLLIVLVVMGHFLLRYVDNYCHYRSLFLFIYSFHMPLFIFISGLSHKNTGICKKVLTYICLGCVINISLFLTKLILYKKATTFELLSTDDVPWFMFSLAAFTLISYVFRNINKGYLLFFALAVALFAGYDPTVQDQLSLSRIIVFYPFYLAGQMAGTENILKVNKIKWLKPIAAALLIFWLVLCFAKLDDLYDYRYLFTGRNPFNVRAKFVNYGFIYRALCYVISSLAGMCILCLVPDRRIPFVTDSGARTMQVYFWHGPVVVVLAKYDVSAKICATPVGKVVWCLMAVALACLLSIKLFSFPTKQLVSKCRTCTKL